MAGDKLSRTSLAPTIPAALRVSDELRRRKMEPELIIKAVSDPAQLEGLSGLVRAASFLDTLPEPVVMIDAAAGKVCYSNKSASNRLGDARAQIGHPLLKGWETLAEEFARGRSGPILSEIVYGMATYERRATYEPNERLVQLSFSEVRKPKEAATATSMNPFPVIEYSLALEYVTSRNEAARKAFPPIGKDHPLIATLRGRIGRLREGKDRAIIDDIEIDGKLFRRAAIYMAQGDMLRIYAVETTGLASVWRVQLLSLIATPLGPQMGLTDVKRMDAAVTSILAALKREKVGLGRLELDMNRLAAILKGVDMRTVEQHELDSMRSVIAAFLNDALAAK